MKMQVVGKGKQNRRGYMKGTHLRLSGFGCLFETGKRRMCAPLFAKG